MDDLLNEFLTETNESIDVVDVELVKLEQDPNNKEVLDNIFRLVHTIKGTCGFLGLPRLESVAHSSENVLGKFRDGELMVTEDSVTVILESLDRIKEILAGLEQTEAEPDGDDSDLIARLDAIAAGEAAAPAAAAAPAVDPAPAPKDDTEEGEIGDKILDRTTKPGEVSMEELEAAFANAPGPDSESETESETTMPAVIDGERTLFERIGGEDTISVCSHLLANRLEKDGAVKGFFANVAADARKSKFTGLFSALFQEDMEGATVIAASLVTVGGFTTNHFDHLISLVKGAMGECQVDSDTCDEAAMTFELVRDSVLEGSTAAAQKDVKKSEVAENSGEEGKRSSQSIRVSVDLLEDLMTMVSELVLTRNQLTQMVRDIDESEFAVPIQRLSQCTTELQEGVMKTRMQPIGNAWAKLPRIVRDLSIDLDKKINLEMKGAETELDRQVLELIKDPLTHMVRNSADHGIEKPAIRLANGKPEQGTILLNAYHEGGHIIIQITDDGAGIPVEKLKIKIIEKELATEEEVAEMTDAQIQKFIFHAGFSMAAKVTNVSGRGVGMDVVRSNIEKIGGTIDMKSTEGKGSTFLIKIPLTLAIVSALIVGASGERFAIPQISVLELVRASGDSEHKIEKIKDTPVLRLRNSLLPLVYINDVLGFAAPDKPAKLVEVDDNTDIEETAESTVSKGMNDDFIVVVQVGNFTFGIVVDQVFDTEEIVVKPVASILKHLNIFSGNTILGDGSVIMILDPNGVASTANTRTDEHDASAAEEIHAAEAKVNDDRESMLMFLAGSKVPKAVPLSLVARLEDIPLEDIEDSDGRYVVQYRDALMPIVFAHSSMELVKEGRQQILVFTDREYTMGLAVDEILDIVEERLDIKLASETEGVVGSAIIAGKSSEVIDVAYFLGMAFDDWLMSRDTSMDENPSGTHQILLIDDSDFFRNMLKPLLTVAGYNVRAVSDARQAIALRDDGVLFDLIVSDIEMPGMTGFEFAKDVKSGGLWQNTPLIALSALAGEKDIAKGHSVGFDDYVAKFDRESLLRALQQQLHIKGDAA